MGQERVGVFALYGIFLLFQDIKIFAEFVALLLKQLAEAAPEGDQTELWNRSAGLWQSALSTLLNKRYAQGSLAMQAEIAAYQENLAGREEWIRRPVRPPRRRAFPGLRF